MTGFTATGRLTGTLRADCSRGGSRDGMFVNMQALEHPRLLLPTTVRPSNRPSSIPSSRPYNSRQSSRQISGPSSRRGKVYAEAVEASEGVSHSGATTTTTTISTNDKSLTSTSTSGNGGLLTSTDGASNGSVKNGATNPSTPTSTTALQDSSSSSSYASSSTSSSSSSSSSATNKNGATSSAGTAPSGGTSPKVPRGVLSSKDYIVGKAPDTPPGVLEYFKAVESLDTSDLGPPRFLCPLDAQPTPTPGLVLPRLFFIPGIEGTGFGLALHHKALAKIFEVTCLSIPLKDRTPFEGLVRIVEKALIEENEKNPERALFVLGESFGAVITLSVAERNPRLPLNLILVNPATSFQRSDFQPLVQLIPAIPDFAYEALPFLLSFSLGNPVKMASSGLSLEANPIEKALGIRDNLLNMMPTLPEVAKLLPKATLEWKLKLLEENTKNVEELLPRIPFPTLILASGEDKLVPSKEEAKRLKELMTGTKVVVRNFSDSGHTLLLEGDLDIAAVIKGSTMYRRTSNPKENPTIDSFPSPTVEDLARIRNNGADGVIRRLSSPIFLSTLEDGTVIQGLSGVPTDHRPILFVGNHQTFAPDLSILVGEFLEKTGVLIRGLAHPMALGMFGGDTADTGASDVFRLFGAVPVTPASTYKLMANGEAMLLFPGGVREALKGRGEEYKLFWPEKEEFIRMAIKFKATIIPFSAVGVDDGYNYVLDGNEQLANPFLGPRWQEFIKSVPKVRDDSAGPAIEQFVPPIVAPKQINRLYFKFQKPIKTTELGFALNQRDVTSGLYRHVKQEVEDGISYLLKKREEDPYKDLTTRILYEASWGGDRQAPTFTP